MIAAVASAVLCIAVFFSGCGDNSGATGQSSGTSSETASQTGGGTDSKPSEEKVDLSFYYPVAVGGPLTKVIDQMAADFTKENPNITVTSILINWVIMIGLINLLKYKYRIYSKPLTKRFCIYIMSKSMHISNTADSSKLYMV